jgi:hypothetical protein
MVFGIVSCGLFRGCKQNADGTKRKPGGALRDRTNSNGTSSTEALVCAPAPAACQNITAGGVLRFTSLLSRGMEVYYRQKGTKKQQEKHILHVNDMCNELMISHRQRRTSLCVPIKCITRVEPVKKKGGNKCLVLMAKSQGKKMGLELGFWCPDTRDQMLVLLKALVEYHNDQGSALRSIESSSTCEGEQCGICIDSPLNGACAPCGHRAGCYNCLKIVQSTSGKCPLCRVGISEVHLVKPNPMSPEVQKKSASIRSPTSASIAAR